MKAWLVILLIPFGIVAHAQDIISSDSTLQRIRTGLPEGWVMSVHDSILTIERLDSVWIRPANHINEMQSGRLDMDTSNTDELAVFRKEGLAQKLSITLLMHPRWPASHMKAAQENNDHIQQEIHNRWDQYGVGYFYHPTMYMSGKPVEDAGFNPVTHSDSLNLARYREEEHALMKGWIQAPDMNTEHFALFYMGESCEDKVFYYALYTDIFPARAGVEYSHVCTLLSK